MFGEKSKTNVSIFSKNMSVRKPILNGPNFFLYSCPSYCLKCNCDRYLLPIMPNLIVGIISALDHI